VKTEFTKVYEKTCHEEWPSIPG